MRDFFSKKFAKILKNYQQKAGQTSKSDGEIKKILSTNDARGQKIALAVSRGTVKYRKNLVEIKNCFTLNIFEMVKNGMAHNHFMPVFLNFYSFPGSADK